MIRLQLEKFDRYGRSFYNALLVAVNTLGHEYVIRIGEFTSDEKIATLFDAAKNCRMVHTPQIAAHMALGFAQQNGGASDD